MRARQLIGELARLGVLRAARGREFVGHLVQGAREILLRAHLAARLLRRIRRSRRAAQTARIRRGLSHRIGRLLHAFADTLLLEIAGRRRCALRRV